MTDEAKALVERLRWSNWYYEDAGENTSYTSEAPLEAADLIETQAREIERLREMLGRIMALEDDFESNAAMTAHEWQMFRTARAALAGDSHD